MKYFIICLCTFLYVPLFGQSDNKDITNNYIHIKGGLFSDNTGSFDYTGFNIINIGWNKYQKNTIQSIELELFGFNQNGVLETIQNLNAEVKRSKRSIELIYSKSYLIGKSSPYGFYIGPSFSLNYYNTKRIPLDNSTFPSRGHDVLFGSGLNMGYNIKLSNKFLFQISSRATILEFGLDTYYSDNPNLTINQRRNSGFTLNIIKQQLQLMLGVSYKI